MSVESPAYEVLHSDGDFEVRGYAGYLTANVTIHADSYNQAVNQGFNLLADFIFGNNTSAAKVAMTAPVTAERSQGSKIAMTAPVTATRAEGSKIAMTAPVNAERRGDEFTVSFTMPSQYTESTLPVPNNPRVKIERIEPYTAAVVRFSGYLTDEKQAEQQQQLDAWIAKQGLTALGAPVSAQYDAPWKPWFARRNEILVAVAQPDTEHTSPAP